LFIFDECPSGAEKKGKATLLSNLKHLHGDHSQLIHQFSSENPEKCGLRSSFVGRVLIPSDSNIFLSNFIDLILVLNKSGDINLVTVFENILTLE